MIFTGHSNPYEWYEWKTRFRMRMPCAHLEDVLYHVVSEPRIHFRLRNVDDILRQKTKPRKRMMSGMIMHAMILPIGRMEIWKGEHRRCRSQEQTLGKERREEVNSCVAPSNVDMHH